MPDRFMDIDMPERFVLECLTDDGAWIDWGLFSPDLFDRHDDGSYVCTGHGGSPVWLRCRRQDGSVIYVQDETGQPFAYRLVPFPGPQYRARTAHAD